MLLKNKTTQPLKLTRWVRFFIAIVLILGLFFRFIHLDRKVYWFDEAATTNRVLGLTNYLGKSADRIVTVADINKYLDMHNPESGSVNTFYRAIDEGKWEPQLPPLYYILLQSWMHLFGSSVAAIRSMSAAISLLALPCIYWLCRELFPSTPVGSIAMALIAISPMQVLYAQEARMYSLHAVAVLLSSAALLRAMRVQTNLSWLIYSAALLVGFYTQTIFFLVAIGHGIYVAIAPGFRSNRVVISYLISLFIALLGFTPWLFILFNYFDKARDSLGWMSSDISKFGVVRYWGVNLSRVFLDLVPTYDLTTDFSSFTSNPFLIAAIAIIFILVGYSIYFICRHTPLRIWLFCLTLIGVTSLALAVPDMILGGYRSFQVRYLIAVYLGIQLTVAYLLATKVFYSNSRRQQQLWRLATIFVISCGILSNLVISPSQTWWNKSFGSEILPIARAIDRSAAPLVLVDSYWWSTNNFGSLVNLLDPKVRVQLVTQASKIKSQATGDIFLFCPSEKLQKELAKQIPMVAVHKKQLGLWKLEV